MIGACHARDGWFAVGRGLSIAGRFWENRRDGLAVFFGLIHRDHCRWVSRGIRAVALLVTAGGEQQNQSQNVTAVDGDKKLCAHEVSPRQWRVPQLGLEVPSGSFFWVL